MSGKIEVVDYNPEWKKLFKAEEKSIKKTLGKSCVVIYHIGSTSVKGLRAQPIIDIMLVVKDISDVEIHSSDFATLGYKRMDEYGMQSEVTFIKEENGITYHIIVFAKSNKTDINRCLAVCYYLENHKEDALKYGEFKTKLAEEYMYDSDGYRENKEEFMRELEKKAVKWHEQDAHIGLCISIGLCIGLSLGTSIGLLVDNVGMGMAFGNSIGMCLGLAYAFISKKE